MRGTGDEDDVGATRGRGAAIVRTTGMVMVLIAVLVAVAGVVRDDPVQTVLGAMAAGTMTLVTVTASRRR